MALPRNTTWQRQSYAGAVRQRLSQIERDIAFGVRHEAIRLDLIKEGFDANLGTFRTSLARARAWWQKSVQAQNKRGTQNQGVNFLGNYATQAELSSQAQALAGAPGQAAAAVNVASTAPRIDRQQSRTDPRTGARTNSRTGTSSGTPLPVDLRPPAIETPDVRPQAGNAPHQRAQHPQAGAVANEAQTTNSSEGPNLAVLDMDLDQFFVRKSVFHKPGK